LEQEARGTPRRRGVPAIRRRQASGKFEVFADGFSITPVTDQSKYTGRPDGVTVAPDGSLYITDSEKGKVWRVFTSPDPKGRGGAMICSRPEMAYGLCKNADEGRLRLSFLRSDRLGYKAYFS